MFYVIEKCRERKINNGNLHILDKYLLKKNLEALNYNKAVQQSCICVTVHRTWFNFSYNLCNMPVLTSNVLNKILLKNALILTEQLSSRCLADEEKT